MRKLFFLLYLFLSCFIGIDTVHAAKIDYTVIEQPEAMNLAKSIDSTGTLKQKKNGFVYLDVSNQFVTEVIPHIYIEGNIVPILTGSKSMGAHISVFTPKERKQIPFLHLEELGKEFSFNTTELRTFYVKGKQLVAVIIESTEIEALRVKYGFERKLQKHDFHITLGKQAATSAIGKKPEYSYDPTKEKVKKVDYIIENQPETLEFINSLPQSGILQQKENGFVYLNVDNDFIRKGGELLQLPGELRILPTSKKSLGAHISVFSHSELSKNEIWQIYEIGKEYTFQIKEIRSFTVRTPKGLKREWAIAVESPELEEVRRSYGLTSKLKGFDFHITFGKQMPVAPHANEKVIKISDLNYLNEPIDPISNRGDFIVVEYPELLKQMQQLEGVGRLHLKSNGFVYLDINDEIINQALPRMGLEGHFIPIKTGRKKMGAHVSVMHEDELIKHHIWELQEANELFLFTIKEIRHVEVSSSSGKKKLWMFAIEAPGLQHLRTKYGLSPKLHGHDFHITIGEELPYALEKPQEDIFKKASGM